MPVQIRTSGRVRPVQPKDGKGFSLDEMQLIVGGYIDVIELTDHYYMVVNEEGKLKNLPKNEIATKKYQEVGGATEIFGDVLISDRVHIDRNE